MKLVIVESPYFHATRKGRVDFRNYLKDCIDDSIIRGEAPFASHAFYTQFLNDLDPNARTVGLRLARQFIYRCDLMAVYIDKGVSGGMKEGMKIARLFGKPIEHRSLR